MNILKRHTRLALHYFNYPICYQKAKELIDFKTIGFPGIVGVLFDEGDTIIGYGYRLINWKDIPLFEDLELTAYGKFDFFSLLFLLSETQQKIIPKQDSNLIDNQDYKIHLPNYWDLLTRTQHKVNPFYKNKVREFLLKIMLSVVVKINKYEDRNKINFVPVIKGTDIEGNIKNSEIEMYFNDIWVTQQTKEFYKKMYLYKINEVYNEVQLNLYNLLSVYFQKRTKKKIKLVRNMEKFKTHIGYEKTSKKLFKQKIKENFKILQQKNLISDAYQLDFDNKNIIFTKNT